MVAPALGLTVGVFVITNIALVIGLLGRRNLLVTGTAFLVLIAFVYATPQITEMYRDHDKKIEEIAKRQSNPKLCDDMRNPRARDKCVFFVGVGSGDGAICASIVDATFRRDCGDYIVRNTAVSKNDESMCLQIQGSDQQYICKKLINERKK